MTKAVTADQQSGTVNYGAASQIERENKAEAQAFIDSIESNFKGGYAACQIPNSTFILPYVAFYFRRSGCEVEYNTDKKELRIWKNGKPERVEDNPEREGVEL